MPTNVFVTGQGIVSALGIGVEENLRALQNQQTGIKLIKHLQTEHKIEFPSGELDYSHEQLQELLNIPKEEPITRTMMLGILAIKEALAQAKINTKEQRVALISSTTVAGMDRSELYYADFKVGEKIEFVNTHLCGATTNRMAEYHGITGLVTTISTACSSSANALMMASRLITSGRYDIVIAGGSGFLGVSLANHLAGHGVDLMRWVEKCWRTSTSASISNSWSATSRCRSAGSRRNSPRPACAPHPVSRRRRPRGSRSPGCNTDCRMRGRPAA